MGPVTPEGVRLDLRPAGPATRILARLLDLAISAVVFGGFVLALAAGGVTSTASVIALLVAIPVLLFVYPAASETLWRGRTVGKAACGLRVVRRDGGPILFRQALVRSLMFIVDGLIFGAAIGVLALVFTRDTVRLGDLAAGTMVVRERSALSMPQSTAFTPPPGWEPFAAGLDVTLVTPADYQLVREVLLRAPQMRQPARERVAAGVAAPLAVKLGLPGLPAGPAETFLRCVAAAYQARHRTASPPPAAAAMEPAPAAPVEPPTLPGAPPRPGEFRPPV